MLRWSSVASRMSLSGSRRKSDHFFYLIWVRLFFVTSLETLSLSAPRPPRWWASSWRRWEPTTTTMTTSKLLKSTSPELELWTWRLSFEQQLFWALDQLWTIPGHTKTMPGPTLDHTWPIPTPCLDHPSQAPGPLITDYPPAPNTTAELNFDVIQFFNKLK